jgi:hypothetical protein
MKYLIGALLLLCSSYADAQYYPWGAKSWKEAVASPAALPTAGNTPGDARVDLTDFEIWIWNGASWAVAPSPPAPPFPAVMDGVVYWNGVNYTTSSDFTTNGSGSITLTNPGGSSVITSNGDGLSQLVLNDTSGAYADSIAFDNSGAMIYNLQMSGAPNLDLIDETTGNNMLAWDSSDNLTIPGNLTMETAANQPIFKMSGADPQLIMNDESGSSMNLFAFEGGPSPGGSILYAWFTNTFGLPFALFDGTTSVFMESWDSSDNLTFNSNTTIPQQYNLTGNGLSQLDLNDTSGGGVSALVFANNGAPVYAIGSNYPGPGAFNFYDGGTGTTFASWGSNDALTLSDFVGNGGPAVSISQAGTGTALVVRSSGGASSGAGTPSLNVVGPSGNAMGIYDTGTGGMGIGENGGSGIILDSGNTITAPNGVASESTMASETLLLANGYGMLLNLDNGQGTTGNVVLGLLSESQPTGYTFGDGAYLYSDGTHLNLDPNGSGTFYAIVSTAGTPSLPINGIGTPTTPTLSFTNSMTESGWYDDGAGNLDLTIGGTVVITIHQGSPFVSFPDAADGITVSGPALFVSSTSPVSVTDGVIPNIPTQPQPMCNAGARGMIWNLPQSGLPDLFQVCQDTTGSATYAWVTH